MFIKAIDTFPGKFTDEKILFSSRESLINFFLRQGINIVITFVAIIVFIFVGHMLDFLWIGVLMAVTVGCGYLFDQLIRYRKIVFIITLLGLL